MVELFVRGIDNLSMSLKRTHSSGFFVDIDNQLFVITSRHVVCSQRPRAIAEPHKRTFLIGWQKKCSHIHKRNSIKQKLTARLSQVASGGKDLAILAITGTFRGYRWGGFLLLVVLKSFLDPRTQPRFSLPNGSRKYKLGEKVSILGYPANGGQALEFSRGILSGGEVGGLVEASAAVSVGMRLTPRQMVIIFRFQW